MPTVYPGNVPAVDRSQYVTIDVIDESNQLSSGTYSATFTFKGKDGPYMSDQGIVDYGKFILTVPNLYLNVSNGRKFFAPAPSKGPDTPERVLRRFCLLVFLPEFMSVEITL
jgi:hypothetical protein